MFSSIIRSFCDKTVYIAIFREAHDAMNIYFCDDLGHSHPLLKNFD